MQSDSQPRVLVTPDDLLGFEIDGRYRLDAIVGGGGMGVVYRTVQQNLNRSVAIKVLKLEDVDSKHRLDRFKREIDIVAQLTHPNIVRVFDTGRDPVLGLHYIAMELVDGASLDEIIGGYRMAPELAIDLGYQIAAALTEPHKLGIVHRDIKPANVLLVARSDDTVGVKVVDFGIARTESGGTGRVTTTGVVVGSPMYMAPEVTRGESLDPRTDLYSLGVLLYELITGSTPFGGTTPVAIMLRHAVEDPPSLSESVGADFPYPELVHLVDDLLRKERRDRPEDAKSVMRALDAIRTKYGISRVEIDGSQPIKQALLPFMTRASKAPTFEEVDAYSPTTPVDAMGRTGSDSFVGWLVSESARQVLGPGQVTATESMEGPMDVEPPPSQPLPLALIVGVVIAAVVGLFIWQGTQGEPPIETAPAIAADPVVSAPAAKEGPSVEPAVADAPDVSVATPDAAVAQQIDAQADAAPAVVDNVPPAKPTSVAKQPRPKRQPKQDEPAPKDDDFVEGMQWVQEK